MTTGPKHLGKHAPTRLGCGCHINPDKGITTPCPRISSSHEQATSLTADGLPTGEDLRTLHELASSMATHVRQELAALRDAQGDLEAAAKLSRARAGSRTPGTTRPPRQAREPGAPKTGQAPARTMPMDLGGGR